MEAILNSGLLGPVVALNAWTFVVEVWMLTVRTVGMEKYKVSMDPEKIKAQLQSKMPANIQWKADNYNHLLEQPTQFYAISLALAIAHATKGTDSSLDVKLAWAYVGIRFIHSLIHATTNVIPRRFVLFVVSSIILAVMTIRCARLVF